VVNEEHLRRILARFTAYYNHARTNISLGKDAPYTRPIERFGHVVTQIRSLAGYTTDMLESSFLEATASRSKEGRVRRVALSRA